MSIAFSLVIFSGSKHIKDYWDNSLNFHTGDQMGRSSSGGLWKSMKAYYKNEKTWEIKYLKD